MRNWSQLENLRDRLAKPTAVTAILAILLIGSFMGIFSPSPPSGSSRLSDQIQAPSQNVNTTRIFVSPNITDTSIGLGSSESFSVSINQTWQLSGINVVLQYDSNILTGVSIDTSSGIFAGSNLATLYNCVDGRGACETGFANIGQAQLTFAVLGSPLTNVSGLLFIINFIVKGKGLSIIHILKADLSVGGAGLIGNAELLHSINFDAYFNNRLCGSQLCRPLAVKVFFPAVPVPVEGRTIHFNSTVANPNGDALDVFGWSWGDYSGELLTYTKTTNATHVYQSPGTHLTVALSVNDTYGIIGLGSADIDVGRIWIQFSINNFALNPSAPSWPGTQISISVQVSSQSSANETSNVSVVLDNGIHGNKTLISKSLFMTATGSNTYLPSYVLDTTPYPPNVYRIVASIQLQSSNSTLYANDTSLSVSTIFLKLIQPLPSNASLSLFQAGGLGIGIVVALYALFVVFKRFFRTKEEL